MFSSVRGCVHACMCAREFTCVYVCYMRLCVHVLLSSVSRATQALRMDFNDGCEHVKQLLLTPIVGVYLLLDLGCMFLD